MKTLGCAVLLALTLSGCAGYRIGPVKPAYLAHVETIAVPAFQNQTFLPHISALVTNTVIRQIQQDGTYRIVTEENADAVLKATILSVSRSPVRSVRGNVLATTEFNLGLTISYSLVDRTGKVLIGPATITGATSFFVSADVTTEERQALPLAAEDVAVRMASQLSEGW